MREQRRRYLPPPLKDFFIFTIDDEFVKMAALEVGRLVVREPGLQRRQLDL